MPDGRVKLTCYASKVNAATAWCAAAPSYIRFFYGKEAFKTWIPFGRCDGEKFQFKIVQGKWTGEWKCREDDEFWKNWNVKMTPLKKISSLVWTLSELMMKP